MEGRIEECRMLIFGWEEEEVKLVDVEEIAVGSGDLIVPIFVLADGETTVRSLLLMTCMII